MLKNIYRATLERLLRMTLVELVVAQSERLKRAGVSFGHGTGNAFDEAAWLVTWALGLPLDALETHGQRDVTADDVAKAEALVARRIETRQPAAYLTGEAWLQNVPFTIDERAIVPRSYIAELLVDGEETGTLDAWLSDRTRRVLDLCTGNGSLAVIAAMAYPEIAVDAADISADALALARINVDRHGLGERITLVESDLFAPLPGRYDLILCNPPYVNDASMARAAAPSTGPSRRSRWPAATTAWTWSGASSPRRPTHMSDDARARARGRPRARATSSGVPAPRMRLAGDERRRRRGRPDRAPRPAVLSRGEAAPAGAERAAPPRRKSRMLVLTQLSLRRGVKLVLDRTSLTHQPGREGRPGRPQRRRQVVAVLAARRPAARRRRRSRAAAALAHRRGRAGDARDRARARPTSCSQGDSRAGRGRGRAGARRGQRRRPRDGRRAPGDPARPAASTPGRARRRC